MVEMSINDNKVCVHVVSFSTVCGISGMFYIKFYAQLRLTNVWLQKSTDECY